jgi:hypothetical protein
VILCRVSCRRILLAKKLLSQPDKSDPAARGKGEGSAMRVRTKSLAVLMTATTAALFASVVTPQQASAADLILGANSYTANTTALTITGPSLTVHGTNVGGIAVFTFGTVSVPNGANLTVKGSRPFKLVATHALIVAGVIQSNGRDSSGLGPYAGGAGGGAGGVGGPGSVGFAAGKGPGGGHVASDKYDGGGGGGFGGKGARGGVCSDGMQCANTTGPAGAAGVANGNLNLVLHGGSGGGGASTVGGGGGGGAIGLFGASITIQSSAAIYAEGGDGTQGSWGASGGGSGGGVILHGNAIALDGYISVIGGAGGGGGCCGDGGGGGGGRIAIQYKSLSTHATFTAVASGGDSGTVPLDHGGLSLDAHGGNGLVTYAQIDASKLTIGANKTITRGHTVTIATKLTDAGTGLAIGARPVTLWKKPKSGGSWTKIATKTTSAAGTASVLAKPGASAVFQWRFGGTLIHLRANSPTQTITVH